MDNEVIIQKLTFDLKINNEKNFFDISNQLSYSINKRFFKELETDFLQFKNENLIIKELIVDIGLIDLNDFNLIGKLISQELKKVIDSKIKNKIREKRSLDSFFYNYITNGYLPWWAPNNEKANDFISKNIIAQNNFNYLRIFLFKNFSNYIKLRRLINKKNFQILFNKCFFVNDEISNYFFELEKNIERNLKNLVKSFQKKNTYSRILFGKDLTNFSDLNIPGIKSKNEIGFQIIQFLLNQKNKSKKEILIKLKSINENLIISVNDFDDFKFIHSFNNINVNNLNQFDKTINYINKITPIKLKGKKIHELLKIADEAGVSGIKGLKKSDIIKKISEYYKSYSDKKLQEKKIHELLKIADEAGVSGIKGLKKSDIIKKISEYYKSYSDKKLQEKKIHELLKIADEAGVSGIKGLKKSDIIKKISEYYKSYSDKKLQEKKIHELLKIADEAGVSGIKGLKKSDIIKKISEYYKSYSDKKLQEKKIHELLKIADEAGVSGIKGLKKSDIIKKISEYYKSYSDKKLQEKKIHELLKIADEAGVSGIKGLKKSDIIKKISEYYKSYSDKKLQEKKIHELLKIADEAGVSGIKGLKKSDIIKKISEYYKSYSDKKLQEKKIHELLKIADEAGVSGIKGLKKSDIIKKISEYYKSYSDKKLQEKKIHELLKIADEAGVSGIKGLKKSDIIKKISEHHEDFQKKYQELSLMNVNEKIFNEIDEKKFFKNIGLLFDYIDPKSIIIKRDTKYTYNEINQFESFLLKLTKREKEEIIKNINEVLFNKSELENFLKLSSSSTKLLLYISKLTLTKSLKKEFTKVLKKLNKTLEHFESRLTDVIYDYKISGLSKKTFQLKLRFMILNLIGKKKKNESIKYVEFLFVFLFENQQFLRLNYDKIFKFLKIKKNNTVFEKEIKKVFSSLVDKNNFLIGSKKIKNELFFKDLIFHFLKKGEIPMWSKRIKIDNEEVLRFLETLIRKKDVFYLDKFFNDQKTFNKIKSIISKSDYLRILKSIQDLEIKSKKTLKKSQTIQIKFDDFEIFKYYIEIGSIPIEKYNIQLFYLVNVIKKTYKTRYFLLKKYIHHFSKNESKVKRMFKIFDDPKEMDLIISLIGKTLNKTIESFIDFFTIIDQNLKSYLSKLRGEKLIYILLKIWSKQKLFCDEKVISILFVDKVINLSKWTDKEKIKKIKKIDKKRFGEIFDFTLNFLELKSKIEAEKEDEFRNYEINVEKDIYEGISINNCGLIIIWPFISKLIEKLELISGNSYVDEYSKTKALLATNYLVNGDLKLKNTELTLNKILCGIELDYDFDETIDLNDYELNLCNMALKAVLKQWKKIKSVRSLREWFFKREGVLIEKDLEYNLIVEKKSQDLLLKFVPWGFLMVKSKIMKKKILVNWKF